MKPTGSYAQRCPMTGSGVTLYLGDQALGDQANGSRSATSPRPAGWVALFCEPINFAAGIDGYRWRSTHPTSCELKTTNSKLLRRRRAAW
jgi:hypothetical protein